MTYGAVDKGKKSSSAMKNVVVVKKGELSLGTRNRNKENYVRSTQSSGTKLSVSRGASAIRKLCTRWIPHNLIESLKRRLVNWCREMMQKFAGGNSNTVYYMWFTDAEEAVAARGKTVEATSEFEFEWAKCFSQCFHRMQRGFELKGCYFKK
ncbi:hypothetical protein EVAR_59252_1 [Eumeta japonica]|uniref:Uncharacterized protein n=1 Tax=Eumeta variegata TaxID=151549 RepID=A0A4C1YJK0_EUMVA|nr:hypothetical protein EVAR_59252_1 [Eumeta japonica]